MEEMSYLSKIIEKFAFWATFIYLCVQKQDDYG